MIYSNDCWLAPPENGLTPCKRPVEYRISAHLTIPGQPFRLVPFGRACGPHLALATQSSILERHHDVLSCLLPAIKPEGTLPQFSFVKEST